MSNVVGSLEVLITSSTSGLTAGLKAAESSLSKFVQQVEAGQLSLKTFSTGSLVLGAGLLTLAGVLGGTAVKAAADWQQQLVETGNNAGMTASQIQEMGRSVLDLSGKTGASKDQLLQAAMYIHDMGYSGKEASDLLQEAAKEGLATGADISSAASTLATVMREFKVPVRDAAKTMDMLHTAAASARMTIQDMVQDFGPVGAQAAAMNVPMDQAAASFAALTRNGFDAAMSATQVRDMLVHIMAPTKSAKAELDALSGGVATVSGNSQKYSAKLDDLSAKLRIAGERVDELGKKHKVAASTMDAAKQRVKDLAESYQALSDKATKAGGGGSVALPAAKGVDLAFDFSAAGLKAKGLVGVLEDLRKVTGGNAQEMNKLIPNLRGGLGALVLTGNAHQDLVNILKAEHGSLGSTESAYAMYANTTAAQTDRMKQQFGNLQIAIGTALLPTVNQVLKAVLPLVQQFAVWAQQHPKLIAAILGGVAAFGALLVVVGAITTVVSLLGPILGVLGGAFAVVAGAISLPVVIIAALGLAIVGLAVLVATHFKQIKAFIGNALTAAGKAITAFAANAGKWFSDAFTAVVNFFKKLPDDVAFSIGFIVGYLVTFATVQVPKFVADVVRFFQQLPGKLESIMTDIVNREIRGWQNIISWVATNVPKLINDVVRFFAGLPPKIGQSVATTKDEFWKSIQQVGPFLLSKAQEMIQWGINIGDAFVKGVGQALSHLGDVFSKGLAAGTKAAKGHSPPSEGPLQHIDQWGFNVGSAWVEGFTKAIGSIQLPSPQFALAGTGGSYNQTTTKNTSVTMNNSFNVQGEANAMNVASFMAFQLEHKGIV